jgi:hypothetical protein
MRIRTDSNAIAHLVDQIAALDDAPDRNRCAWFYADLARLAADAIDDYVIQELHEDLAAERHEDAFNRGHDAGYRRGWDDARHRTGTVTSASPHRTAERGHRHRGWSA